MEQQTPETQPSPKFIEIEAPEYLEEGQNFYDQPPFNQVLGKVSTQSPLELAKLRTILTSAARKIPLLFEEVPKTPVEESANWEKSIRHNHSLKRGLRNHLRELGLKSQEEIEQYFDALIHLAIDLRDYPFWHDYISNQSQDYLLDGTPFPSKRGFGVKVKVFPKSYASWVAQKAAAAEMAVLKGIDEIFPQDIGGEIVAIPQRGERQETKRWRILKAAEFVATKKK